VSAHATAEVRLHGRTVGILEYDRGGSTFTYVDDVSAPEHTVLGQVFEEDPRTTRTARIGLPAWFANLLPEGEFRRQVVREMGGGRVGDYRLLLQLGGDLPGAVTVHGDTDVDDSDDVTAEEALAVSAEHPLRYSLAGIQLKYSVHSSRLTIPVRGGGKWWIVKLPDRSLPGLAENEYVTMRWLAAAGMEVPAVALTRADTVKDLPEGFVAPHDFVYLVQRFDRGEQGRVHVEDFAQVANVEPAYKYGEFGATYDSVGLVVHQLAGLDDFLAYVERLVAAVVAGNTDAHLKNWALWYPDGRSPRLSPVYDFHSLTIYRERFRYAPLTLTLAGEQMPNLVTPDHFRRLAEHCGADAGAVVDRVAATIGRLRDAWSAGIAAEAAARFEPLARHYERRLGELPICRAA
jgi:serine/threonine-protein kinase HipA